MRRILIVTALALFPAGRAVAADGKVYPASMCQPKDATHAERASFLPNGRVCNVSEDADLHLRCPVVRDAIAGHVQYVRIYAKTGDPDGVWCRLKSLKPDTADGLGSHHDLTVFAPYNNPDAWSWDQSAADLSQVADGPYELDCILPHARNWSGVLKQSCLGAYHVEESD